MKVSTKGFGARWSDTTQFSTGIVVDMKNRCYLVTVAAKGEGNRDMRLELTEAEVKQVIEANEKRKAYEEQYFQRGVERL